MANESSAPEYPDPFPSPSWPTNRLDLASLNPQTVAEGPAYVEGVVTLLWPYSESSSTLSFLVCEEDFRRRLNRGQLRVCFKGSSARVVEARKVQIGNAVRISLNSASLEERNDATARDVPWVVGFSGELAMQVNQGSGWSNIEVEVSGDLSQTATEPVSIDHSSTTPSPRTATPPPTAFSFSQTENEWSTPGVLKRTADFLDLSSPFGILFDEEEGENSDPEQPPRKKPRFSSSFRLHEDRSPSPETASGITGGATSSIGGQDVLDETTGSVPARESESASTHASPGRSNRPNHIEMPPPPAPRIVTVIEDTGESHKTPRSPSLRPVQSPGLPLISPFLHQGLSSGDYLDVGRSVSEAILPGPIGPASPVLPDAASVTDVETTVQHFLEEHATINSERVESPNPEAPSTTNTVQHIIDEQTPADVEMKESPSPKAPLAQSHLEIPSGVVLVSTSDEEKQFSDGESEKDSLFDELSDGERSPRRRLRSKSPKPGPSPLRKVAGVTSPPRPGRLNLKALPSPLKASETVQTPATAQPKTPFLYLPTPSPKQASEGTQFPFTAPPKLPAVPESPLEAPIPSSLFPERRRLFGDRDRRESAPSDLSAYFGRPKRKPDAVAEEEHAEEEKVAVAEEEQAEKEKVAVVETEQAEMEKAADVNPDTPGQESNAASQSSFQSGITTSLSDFTAIADLQYNCTVDIIGVVSVTSPIERAKKGQKDFFTSMKIVDSSQPEGIDMRVFRPYKEALPKVKVGDVILLRSFKMVTMEHQLTGVSTDNSAWAVWKDVGKGTEPEMAGPPVEYAEEETNYAKQIRSWYEKDFASSQPEKQLDGAAGSEKDAEKGTEMENASV